MASTSKSHSRSQRTSKQRNRTEIKSYQSGLLDPELPHMANVVSNMDDKYKDKQLTTTQVCICCLTEEYSDMGADCTWTVQMDVYEQMLHEIFNISIQEDIKWHLICEDCIKRLHEALNFKKQIIESQKKLLDYILRLRDKPVNESNGIKTEMMIYENLNDCINDDAVEESYITEDTTKYIKDELQNNLEDEPAKSINIMDTKDVEMHVASGSRKRIPNEGNKSSMRVYDPNREKLNRDASLLVQYSNILPFRWRNNKYMCFCCKEMYLNMASLREHTLQKHNKDDLVHQIHNRYYPALPKADTSNLNCDICSKSFVTVKMFSEHLATHGVNLETKDDCLLTYQLQNGGFECQKCAAKFDAFKTLNNHMNEHFGTYICCNCGAGFQHLFALKCHETRHLDKVYTCKKCELFFPTSYKRLLHYYSVHKKGGRYGCPHCDEKFMDYDKRTRHLAEIHGISKPGSDCMYCGKTFKNSRLLNQHIRFFHLNERKHVCEVCEQKFFNKTELKKHLETHKNI